MRIGINFSPINIRNKNLTPQNSCKINTIKALRYVPAYGPTQSMHQK
jgi:hypothetical protein